MSNLRSRYRKAVYLKKQKAKPQKDKAKATETDSEYSSEQEEDVASAIAGNRPMMQREDELLRLLLHQTVASQERLRHCIVPAFNVSQKPLENWNQLRQYPTCCISMPQAIYLSNKNNNMTTVDHAYRKLYAKQNYEKRLLLARTRYLNLTKNNRQLRALEKNHVYHRTLFHLAERLHTNPDKYFNNSYDYYFSAGNLCTLPQKRWVLHTDGLHLNSLNVSRLSSQKQLNLKSSLAVESNEPIYELRALQNNPPQTDMLFASRQRNCIQIYELQRKENTLRIRSKFTTKRTPFISFAQSPHDTNKLMVSSMKQHISVYDMNAEVPSLLKVYKTDKSDNNVSWNMLQPSAQSHCLLYVNERNFMLLDVRCTPAQWLQTTCGFADDDLQCDFVCNVQRSAFEQLVYVATNHKLHLLDVRCLGKHFNETPGAVCNWTHQLNYAPLLMQTFRSTPGSECIALSSALPGDMCICELTADGNCYRSYCLPYQPTTLQEAYEDARLRGHCLQPQLALKQRLQYCTTGLAYVGDETNSLLSTNSIGDVFMHRISKRNCDEVLEQRTGQHTDEIMCNYAKQIEQQPKVMLNHTVVHEMKTMRKIFRCPKLDTPQDEVEEGMNGTAKLRRPLGRWQQSFATLQSYKDALVNDILAVWDIDCDPLAQSADFTLNNLSADMHARPEPISKVSNWLNSSANTPMEDETPATATLPRPLSANVNEELNFTGSPFLYGELQTQNESQINLRSRTVVRAKKKFIKGF